MGDVQTLEEVCELIIDCPHSTPPWTETGYLVIRNQNIRNGRLDLSQKSYTNEEGYQHRIRRAKPKAGDLIFTREAPMGEVCIIPEGLECCVGQRQVLLRPSADINPVYLFYAMLSPQVQHQVSWNEGTGSTVSNVRIPVLKAITVTRFDQAEEKAIANVLAALDDKIELNRRTNETLEAMAQAVFKDWFVDFGPVRRKQAGETDPAAILGGLLPPSEKATQTAALFPDSFGDNGLPEGWEVSRLQSFGEVVTGKTPSKKKTSFYGPDVPFLKIPDMRDKIYVLQTTDSLSFAGANSQKNKTLPEGSISVSCIATPGLVVLNHRQTQTNQQINTLVPFRPEESLFCFWTCRKLADAVMRGGSGGSVFHNMNKSTFGSLECVAPTSELRNAFSEIVQTLHSKMLWNGLQNQTLAQTRDYLLPKLMSGQIRAAELESMVA